VVARLSADIEEDTRQKRFHVMMDRYLAVDTITAFVTGPYWNEATASERDAFRAAFRDLLGARFLPALAKAGDVDIDIVGKRTLRDGLWSVTARVRPGGTSGPTRVQLRVMQQEGSLRIADVVTRGISLGVTLREEYTSYLERHDGDFGALTERVRSRAADLRP
jgi:phospholipid transport system substrate-binding protein